MNVSEHTIGLFLSIGFKSFFRCTSFIDIATFRMSRKVRNPVLGRIGDAFFIVRIQHRGLNIGMPKHLLDLVDRGAVFESDRGR